MSEQINEKYNAEVRRIAEVLAKTNYRAMVTSFMEVNTWESLDDYGKEISILAQEEAACAMVAEMAKCYEDAYFSNYGGTEDSDDYVLWNENCISEMQERGLIPSPEKGIK